MTKTEFFGEFVKHEVPYLKNMGNEYFNICANVYADGCQYCPVNDKCFNAFDGGLAVFTIKEFEEVQEQYPEYFI